ncbi:MAG: DNA gyrase subunit A [Parcubacteria group bacterium]|nr:DNA gyrase subunit A [Parcubacteria group bacterium]
MDIGKLQKREITEEMRESYLDYAMSVIVARALPDARDGLKPVHRRILFAMHELGLRPGAKFVKSARVVGEVLGKFHPHGDLAVYESLVRLAQPFSLRYPLVLGQGNFGSLDGDSPAAQRYTEAKLAPIAEELLEDIEKNTVDFRPNYDDTRQEPAVLPGRLPNLLVNGSMGIAVGMATNIPPHNLSEVADALSHLLRYPDATNEDLVKFIQGPDFPTGGMIFGKKAIVEAYATGKGSILVRGKAEIEEGKRGFAIVVSEIPYEVNKAELVAKIAELVEAKRIEGIRDIRDESDKEGLRVVVELKNDANPKLLLNQLYRFTDLEKTFHMNMLALVDGLQPQVLSLKRLLEVYLSHRSAVVTRRTEYDLEKTKERAHILEGLAKALEHIDAVIKTIRASENKDAAKAALMKKFDLSEKQAVAILEMRLESLAKLEREKIMAELAEKQKLAKELTAILKDPKKILGVVGEELEVMKKKFGDTRRTAVHTAALGEVSEEELVPEEEVAVAVSQSNYVKRMPPQTFRLQRRGGKGVIGFEAKASEDAMKLVVSANTHDWLLFFTNRGRVFQTRAYEIPAGSRVSRGKPIQNVLSLTANEEVTAVVGYNSKRAPKEYLVLATKNGILKKTALREFHNVRRGMIAITLKKNDALRWAELSSGKADIVLVSASGQAIRFPESQVRSMGRASAGVLGMRLRTGDALVGMGILEKEKKEKVERLLVMTKNGYGKQTPIASYRIQRRGGVGIKTAKVTEKTGPVIAARLVADDSELIAASEKGQAIRIEIAAIPVLGRQTQGVRVMKLASGDSLAAMTTF